MCGIFGAWGEVDSESLQAMMGAIRHRGPDDSGVFTDSRVSLGMTRLAVIDLSQAAHQPMHNKEKTIWIVYNGEMYNFEAERRLLEESGHTFLSRSDTEVVLKLYEQYGDEFLARLRGMFALAIYDRRRGAGRERLLLARDQLGIKPLLVARLGKTIVFASELKALLASGLIDREVDPVGLRLLLSYGSVYQPRTMVKGVSMVLPAHRLILDERGEHMERYWSLALNRVSGLRAENYSGLVERVAQTLEESVRLQMISDVPIGAFLSGGVDSSLLVGLMTRIAGRRVKTFSVGFEAEGTGLDESQEAEKSAQFFGAEHTRVIVNATDVRNRIEHIALSLDQPSVDGVNSYFVSLAAGQDVTVAISGTGGDELFAGYPWFAEMAAYDRETKAKLETNKARRFMDRLLRSPFLGPFRSRPGIPKEIEPGFLARYGDVYQIMGPSGATRMILPELRAAAGGTSSAALDLKGTDELAGAEAVERVSALCLRGYTANQLLRDIDTVSMAHSLEVRVPFLDVPLVDLSLSLPVSAKLRGRCQNNVQPYLATYRESGSKKILIDAGRSLGILPNDIDEQPKRGFAMPFDPWLKGPLREIMDEVLSPKVTRRRGLLSDGEVQGVKDQFLEGKRHWSQPWLLMMLELWCRKVLDGKPSTGQMEMPIKAMVNT